MIHRARLRVQPAPMLSPGEKVHSIPDVAAGYALGVCLLGFWLRSGDAVDAFLVETPWVSRHTRPPCVFARERHADAIEEH